MPHKQDRNEDAWPARLPDDIKKDLTTLADKIRSVGNDTTVQYFSLRARVNAFLSDWRGGVVNPEGLNHKSFCDPDDFLLSFIELTSRKPLEQMLWTLPGDGKTKSARRNIAERKRLCEMWNLLPKDLAEMFPGQMQSRRFLADVYLLAKAADKDTVLDILDRARRERRGSDRASRRRGVKKDIAWTPADAVRAVQMLEDEMHIVIRRRKPSQPSSRVPDDSSSSEPEGTGNYHDGNDGHDDDPDDIPDDDHDQNQHPVSSPERGRNTDPARVSTNFSPSFTPAEVSLVSDNSQKSSLDNNPPPDMPESPLFSTNSQKHPLSNHTSPTRHKKLRPSRNSNEHILAGLDVDDPSFSYQGSPWYDDDAPSGLFGSIGDVPGAATPRMAVGNSDVTNAAQSPPVFGGGPPYAKPREYLNVDQGSMPELLNFGSWIGDTVINSALRLLNLCRPSDLLCVSSLATASSSPQTWIPNLARENLKIILLPLHIKNSHWVLAVAHPQEQKINVFDSLPQLDIGGQAARDTIKAFISAHGDQIAAWETWKVRMVCCPNQPNNFDCGIYIIAFAYHVAISEELPQQLDGRAWRYMLLCLLGKTLEEGLPDVMECIKPPQVQGQELEVPALPTVIPNAATDPEGFTKFLESYQSFRDKMAVANERVKVTLAENSQKVAEFCENGQSLISHLRGVVKITKRLNEMAEDTLRKTRGLSSVAGGMASSLRTDLQKLRGFGIPLGAAEQDAIKLIDATEAIVKGMQKDIPSSALLEGTRNLLDAAVEDLRTQTTNFESEIHKRRVEADRWQTVLA